MKELNSVEQLFREYYASMFKIAYRVTKDKQASKDVVQDVFFNFWKSKEKIEIGPGIKGYLFKATINLAVNYVKRNKKQVDIDSLDREQPASVSDDPMQKLLSGDLQEKINTAILNLPPKCQSIFMMSRFEGMKNKEIAEATGLSIKTVENQMGIALKKLKDELAPFITIGSVLLILGLLAGMILT